MLTKVALINFLQQYYPDTDNGLLCQQLGLSYCALTTLASRNGIHKSKNYLAEQHKKLLQAKEKAYLSSIPDIKLSLIEQNIIVGSILGDGSLTFAQRSRNAYYREHFSIAQQEYRQWKMHNINSLSFRIEKDVHLKSPSHPVFTNFYNQFYINGQKTITKDNIKLLNHPIGLMCLYLDDGTLTIYADKTRKTISIIPSISIATLCFSQHECEIICNHLYDQFELKFSIVKPRSSKGCSIKLNRIEEIKKFLNIIKPNVMSISCMEYKWNLDLRIQKKYKEIKDKYHDSNIVIYSTGSDPNYYSEDEILMIINMKKNGNTNKQIAQHLNRSYSGITDKIQRLNKKGLIFK